MERAPTVEEVERRLCAAGFISGTDPGLGSIRIRVCVRDGAVFVRAEGEHTRKVCFGFFEVRTMAQLRVLEAWLRERCGGHGRVVAED